MEAKRNTMLGVIATVWVTLCLGYTTVFAAQLPPEMLVDKYLLQAKMLSEEKKHKGALQAMDRIVALQKEHDLTLPEAFPFHYAQTALAAGSVQATIDSANRYLTAAGREGKYRMDVEAVIELAGADVDHRVDSAMISAGSSTARTEAQEGRSEYSGPLLSAVGTVVATLLGVIVAFWLTGIRERDSKTFELVRLYQTTFDLHGKVLLHLNNWNACATPSIDQQNEIRLMGNWINTMAALIVTKCVDERLVDDLGIREDIKFFGSEVFGNPIIHKQLNADGWKFIKKVGT